MSDTTSARAAATKTAAERRVEQFRAARNSVNKRARVQEAKKLGYTVVGIAGAGVIGR